MSEVQILECTKEHPWDHTLFPLQRVRHHGAVEVHSTDRMITWECKFCGSRWAEEIAE